MATIEKKSAYFYNEKAYATRLDAQKAEFHDLFRDCRQKGKSMLYNKYAYADESLTDQEYWEIEALKIEELTEALQDLLCYREQLLAAMKENEMNIEEIEYESNPMKRIEEFIPYTDEEMEEEELPDFLETIQDLCAHGYSYEQAKKICEIDSEEPEIA